MMTYDQIATATLEQLTDELAAAGWDSTQTDIRDAREAVRCLLLEMSGVPSFRFATDSETGTIEAKTFGQAVDKLREMVPSAAVADGAWGWVQDLDGQRYRINC